MIWKTVLIASFVVGALAGFEVPEAKREEMKKKLQEVCTKNGAADKISEVETSIHTFIDCVKQLFNPETLTDEIEKARPNGALDEVFQKYCAKAPQLKSCIHNAMAGITPCISASYREYIPEANNGTDQLIDFVCHKDGDRIALFIAEGGPECFQSKQQELRQCGTDISNAFGTVENAEKATLKERCAKYDTFSTCVVKALESCSTPTPGNMAESMLRFVRNGSHCSKA